MMLRADIHPVSQMAMHLDKNDFYAFFSTVIEYKALFPTKAVEHARYIISGIAKPSVHIENLEALIYAFFAELKNEAKEKNNTENFDKYERWELMITYALFFRFEGKTRFELALPIKLEAKNNMVASLREKNNWFDTVDLSKSPGISWILENECADDRNMFRDRMIEILEEEYVRATQIISQLIDFFAKEAVLTSEVLEKFASKENFPYNQYIQYNIDNKPGGELTTESASVLEFIKLYCAKTFNLTFNKDDKHPDYAKHRIFFGMEPFKNLDGLKINLNRVLHRQPTMILEAIPAISFEKNGIKISKAKELQVTAPTL